MITSFVCPECRGVLTKDLGLMDFQPVFCPKDGSEMAQLHDEPTPAVGELAKECVRATDLLREELRREGERVKQLEASDVKWLPEPTVSGWYWVRDAAGKKSIKPHNLFNYSIMEQLQSENYYGGKWVFPIEFSGPILPPA